MQLLHTLYTLFDVSHVYSLNSVDIDPVVLSRCTNFTQNTLNHHSTCPSKITFYNLQNGLREKHMKKLLEPENVNTHLSTHIPCFTIHLSNQHI